MPSLPSCSARRSAPRFVRVNTSTCSTLPAAHEVAEELALAAAVDRMDDLPDGRHRGVAGRRVDRGRVAQQVLRERADRGRERGAEEQALALGRQQREDAPDVGDEAHVQHAIGLVEDEDLDAAEVDGALPDVVEQPTGRGHHDLGARRAAHAPGGPC